MGDRSRIATIADGSEQSCSRRRLAVTRAIVDVVCANHRPRQLLHEVTLFIRALGGRDESHAIGPACRFELGKSASNQAERLVPGGGTKLVTFANQWRGQTIRAVDMAPAELSLHARRNAIGWTVFRGNLEAVAILGPDIETASHAAVGANCFRLADAVRPHC